MLKYFAKATRGYRLVALITPLFMIMEVLMESTIIYTCKDLINMINVPNFDPNAITNVRFFLLFSIKNVTCYQAVWIFALQLFAMAMISLGSGIGGGVFGAKASVGFAANLRHDIFYNINDFSFENIDSFQTSSLVTRLTTDISMVQMAYQMMLRIVIRVPLQMIMAIILAFNIDGRLPWLFIIIIPFLAFGLGLIIRLAMPTFRRLFKKYDSMNNSVQENIRGIRVVKTYVREDYEINKFNNVSDSLSHEFTKAERIVALNNPVMQFFMHVAILLMTFIGSKAIINENIAGLEDALGVGDLQSLITYGIQMLGALMMFSMIFVMMSMAYECAVRIVEVLKTKSNLTNPENPVYEVKDGSIVFDNVNFKYHKDAKKFALYDINLNIPSGSTVGILGGTGSAKSTLISLISRLYDTTEGNVKVGGLDVRDYDLKTLRDNVSVVLQKNVLFSGTITENLRWGNENATEEEIKKVCDIAQASSFIETLPDKYDTFIEQGGTNVSGGQKQRLCIARALLKNPKILVFDDSTSAVDTKTDALIRKGLSKYLPDVTKLIIAQRTSSIMDADIIIVMDNGTINGIGTHDELLKNNAIYQEVYYAQNKVGEE